MSATAGGRSRQALFGAIVGMAISALAAANVLLVGIYNGIADTYRSIQSAVDQAKCGLDPGRLRAIYAWLQLLPQDSC